MKHTFFALLFFLFSNFLLAENKNIVQIGLFSSGNLDKWENKTFSGQTNYQISQLDYLSVLKAESHSGASGLFKEQRIDLQKTPYLNWSWRIDNRLSNLNEQAKSGDDYSARIYVVVSGGWAFWKTKAINYVWASNTAKGTVWPNAFAGKNAMMIAVRSADDKTKTWFAEKRNIMHDLKQQFGTDIRFIDAVAIMTDTDNAKGNAIAYYGDIYFSKN
jgi:hypothetical protein